MSDNKNGYILLLSLLLAAVIIAIIVFAKSGVYEKLTAPQPEQSGVKVQLNEMQNSVNQYNDKVNNEINK